MSDNIKLKLKPCPFCGNDFLGVHIVMGNYDRRGYVCCHNCGAKGKTYLGPGNITEDELKLKVEECWNERVEG